MKTRLSSNKDMPSPISEGETIVVASKRKATSLLTTILSTDKGAKTTMPKRLRTTPATASPTQSISTSPPSPSTNRFSSLPPTPRTPQTPSKPAKPAIIGTEKLGGRKQRIIHDPINIAIYDLRKQALDWIDIADKTNEQCNLVGTDAELTGPACYSRFFRNSSLVARTKGEVWKRELYVNMKGPVTFAVDGADADVDADATASVVAAAADDSEDIVEAEVMKAVEKVRGDFWGNVQAMVNENLSGEMLTIEKVKAIHDRARDRET